ncbi:mRNA-decapping enzyme-like protein [Artemisia annua]|uniref:mRNA-decapping enzyme-like protein n=1 Tax=Artemisia annua TaxID=35608 RepID=A0A2U1QMM7_ARTAN|nr:mRNA-decapping enzyme-like protein [Artemisia annua]
MNESSATQGVVVSIARSVSQGVVMKRKDGLWVVTGQCLRTQTTGRKDVEGSLFVIKRNTQPRFQFIVMNRRNTGMLL